MSYTLQNLGAYTGYSYDPRIRDGVVYAGQDRATGGRFDIHAAIWDGSWTILPDPDTSIRGAVARDGIADLTIGHIDIPAAEAFSRAMTWEFISGAWVATALPLPTGALGSIATSVNDAGTIIGGEMNLGNLNDAGALWIKQGGVWTVEVLPQPDIRGTVVGLNAAGDRALGTVLDRPNFQPAQWTDPGGGWSHATLAFPTGADPVDVYGGVEGSYGDWAAGWVMVGGGPSRAARWHPGGMFEDIGVGDHSSATGIAPNEVVGIDASTGNNRGFHWSPVGGLTDVHIAGQDWSYPGGVDTTGRIVGVAGKGDPQTGYMTTFLFLLTPP